MRLCAWCQDKPVTDPRATFCGRRCRQAAFRLRRRRATEYSDDRPMRMAYADPPYPGLSSKYYRDEPTYAGEVDHVALIAGLSRPGVYDGWALSTSSKALRLGGRVWRYLSSAAACGGVAQDLGDVSSKPRGDCHED